MEGYTGCLMELLGSMTCVSGWTELSSVVKKGVTFNHNSLTTWHWILSEGYMIYVIINKYRALVCDYV
jgi:hypothetical protein